jgi:hypothetical protein
MHNALRRMDGVVSFICAEMVEVVVSIVF